ncbi:MAG: rod shape-determining protein MreC [candidate division Zixibacteria bacterium]|nr:rod shape-determining protein MreC [candidate division Zixibacteria bacterium]
MLLSILFVVAPPSITSFTEDTIFRVFYYPFATIKNSVGDLRSVADDNRRLQRQLTEASMMLSMYIEAGRENARLRSVLGFEPRPGYALVPAGVISVAGSYLPISVVINKGSSDTVQIDQPVINREGLVGRITSVGPDFATVQLLTDPSNRVAARVATSREMGIIKFTAPEGMILDNFPVQGKIAVGDSILSSGLGGVYPAGLTVGTVTEVVRPDLAPFCRVKVEPVVNFRSVEELFVLRTGER